MHPFIDALYGDNSDLFNGLLEDAKKSYPKIVEQVNSAYNAKSNFDIKTRNLEIVTKALANHINNKYELGAPLDTFTNKVQQFFKWFASILNKLLSAISAGKLVVFPSEIESATSLSEIADMILTKNVSFNFDIVPGDLRLAIENKLRPAIEKIKARANELQKKIIDDLVLNDPQQLVLYDKAITKNGETKNHIYVSEATGQVYTSVTTGIKGSMSSEQEDRNAVTLLFGNQVDAMLEGIAAGLTFEEALQESVMLSQKANLKRFQQGKGFISGISEDILKGIYNTLNDLIKSVYDAIKNKGVGVVKINFKASILPNSSSPDENLSEVAGTGPSDKVGTIKKYLEETVLESGNEQKTLRDFINEKKVIINTLTEISTDITTSFNRFNCLNPIIETNDTNPNVNVNVMACNSVRIESIVTEIAPESNTVSENQTPVTQPVIAQQPTLSQQSIEGLSKRLLRNLLSECDYFEVIKEDDPMLYDSISQKIKYFQPAFHSITPEGLNSRLTFLQQCMRPGETIPTIGADGQPKTNDALNTSFGAPPVLILRVGDFFNTKIIPNSLSIKYDNLDINPEGIGVQPMIATVTMAFNFIGGHGLNEPVQKLQNALSFNYYANTEMYDERATPTEDTTELDKKVLDAILAQVPPPREIVDNITNNGGNTIGEITNDVQTSSGETGTLSYFKTMEGLVTECQTYFDSTISGFDGIINNYNYGILQLTSDNRKYTSGNFGATSVNIVGKSNKIQDNIDKLFNSVISDINNESNPVFTEINNNDIANSDKRIFKTNYKNYLQELKNSFSTNLNSIVNDITNSQQNLVFTVEKINYLIDEKADGIIQSNGDVKIYKLASNNEDYGYMVADYATIAIATNAFQQSLIVGELLFDSYTNNTFIAKNSDFNNQSDIIKAEYMIICQKLLKNTNEFLDSLTTGVSNELKDVITSYYQRLKIDYEKEFNAEVALITEFKNDSSEFTKFVPLSETPLQRDVEFEVAKASSSQRNKLIKLYDEENSGGNNTYNGKYKFLW